MQATSKQFKLSSLIAAMALAGCSSLVEKRPVVLDPAASAVPAFKASATAAVQPGLAIDRWWLHFDDPQLTRLIDEALAHNEDLESAVARVREAQASLDVAAAAQSPTLDFGAQSSRSQQSAAGAMPIPPGVDRRASSHQISLTAGYEVDLWGRISSLTAAARQQLLGAEWARSAVEWGLTARVADAYFGLAAVDRQIEISEFVRDSRAKTLQLRQREHAAGAGNELDVRRAEAELTTTEATLASLARQRILFERALTVLLGRTPHEIVNGELARRRLDEKEPYAAALPQGAASDLLVRRPDVRQAEAQLAASNASIDAARAATLPSVRLSGVLGSDARSVGNLFSGPSIIFSLLASVTQSIADGGKAQARVREEHARAEQAVASYRRVIAGAVLDVRAAYATLDVAHQSYLAERNRVTALARAREIARVGYENGALSYLDLLDADRNLYQAQLDLVSAYREQLIGQVAAFKALGGGYSPSIAQAKVSSSEAGK